MEVKLLTTKDSLRTNGAIRHLNEIGLNPKVFYAIPHKNAKTSFNMSMRQIMSESEGTLLLFEDDVYIKDFKHFYEAILQLPSDWELCYLGANLVAPIEPYSDNLYKTYGAWTTHAVMYNNPKKLCEKYEDINVMFDDWLREHIHPRGNSYIIKPMMAWQRPHKSDLWDHYADYTKLFDDSANKLI